MHTRLRRVDGAEMVLVRCLEGLQHDTAYSKLIALTGASSPIRAVFFLVGDTTNPGRHMRILGRLCARIEDRDFMANCTSAGNQLELPRTVISDDRFPALRVRSGTKTECLINVALVDLDMPKGTLVAMIHRRGETIVPGGNTVLSEGDDLAVIGEPRGIGELTIRFGADVVGDSRDHDHASHSL